MSTKLTTKAVKDSSFIISVVVKNYEGVVTIPTSLKWSLFDSKKQYINNREDVNFTPLAKENDILLSGADLAIPEKIDIVTRYLLVNCILSDGTIINDSVKFFVTDPTFIL